MESIFLRTAGKTPTSNLLKVQVILDSSQAGQYGFLAVNNTWHFFVRSLDVWSLMRYRDAMQSQKPCHRSDPQRNGVLTLTAQSKGQTDVTGIWAGNREMEGRTQSYWKIKIKIVRRLCAFGHMSEINPDCIQDFSTSGLSLFQIVINHDKVSAPDFCPRKVNCPAVLHCPLCLYPLLITGNNTILLWTKKNSR